MLKQHKPRATLLWLPQPDPFLAFLGHLVLTARISPPASSSGRGLWVSVWFNLSVWERVSGAPQLRGWDEAFSGG